MQDNAGNITYKHYILAGSARVGVETVATTSGTVNSDTLSFFVQDQVGSVVAEVTEGLGGLNQQLTVYGHDPWGKARPTSGAGANLALLPGIFQPASAVMAGQHEGFAGHEDLEDIGIVDMEGRIYDPEVGRFLSADPTVQYPDSSQGYNRYTYCNSNPLSFSDPTGYSYLGDKAQEGMHLAFYAILAYLSGGAASAAAEYGYAAEAGATFGGAAITGYVSSGGDVHTAIITGLAALAFNYVGDHSGWFSSDSVGLVERSAVEGVIGGAFSRAGGGSFRDGFIGTFVGSETSGVVDDLAPNNEAERMVISAMIGGTATSLSGGSFTNGAIMAAMQRLFNDEGGEEPEDEEQANEDNAKIADAGVATDPAYQELARQLKMYDEDFDPSEYPNVDSMRDQLKEYAKNGFCGPFGEVDANKVNHIFENSGHNLLSFELKFDSRAAAYEAVWNRVQAAASAGDLPAGIFTRGFTVNGTNLTVQGRVFENGSVRVGDFWAPP